MHKIHKTNLSTYKNNAIYLFEKINIFLNIILVIRFLIYGNHNKTKADKGKML